jgi:hypothetical protein
MTGDRTQPDAWQPCPAGQLQQMVNELKSRRQRQRLYRIWPLAGGLTLALLTGPLLWKWAVQPPEGTVPKLTCRQVKPLLESYVAGTLADTTTCLGIARHLNICPPCARLYRQLRSAQKTARASHSHGPHRPACCKTCSPVAPGHPLLVTRFR